MNEENLKKNDIVLSTFLITFTAMAGLDYLIEEKRQKEYSQNILAFMQESIRATDIKRPLEKSSNQIQHAIELDTKTYALFEDITGTKIKRGEGSMGNWVALSQDKPYVLAAHNKGADILDSCKKALNTSAFAQLKGNAEAHCFKPLQELGKTAGVNFSKQEMNNLQEISF